MNQYDVEGNKMHLKFMKKAGAAIMAAAMALNGTAISISSISAADETKYEFEDGVLTGTVETITEAGASGGKVAYMQDNGTVGIEVDAPSTGMYTVTIYAQGVGGSKIQSLAVNGVNQGDISIPESTGFEPTSITVKLNEGKNMITVSKSWGWSKFDYLTISAAELPEIKATQTTCCDVDATDETRALMSYLSSVYGNNIISGQQEIYMNGPHDFEYEFEYLNDLTGHYPAIRGFDFLNCANILYGSEDGTVDRIIDWAKNRNGIVTASWHITVPKKMEGYKVGDTNITWNDATYSVKDENGNPATDFVTSNVLKEGTVEREYYLTALKALAGQFQKLQDAGVPVIWRPLHEAEGGGGETGSWFWWGKDGSEVYKEIWKLTYDTLVNEYNIHNLIWAWNSYNYEYSQDWYPGDEYVDIIGYDKYNCTDWSTGSKKVYHNDSAISSTFYGIMEKYDSKKMVAMAENDSFSTVKNLTDEKAGWLYFCTWYDGSGSAESDSPKFLSDPMFNTKEDTIEMYQSDYCITLDELPADLYSKETPKPDPIQTTTKTTQDPAKTTTTVTTEVDPTKDYGKVVYDKTKKIFQITLPEASKDFYIDVELPDDIEYANGGLGVSVELDGEYYWANIQWEANASGSVKINVIDNFFNCSLGMDVIEDEALIKRIKAELGKATVYEGQVWYAQKEDKETDTDGVKIVSAYLKKNSSDSTTTTTESDEKVEVTLWGDANCDGKVTIADATAIIQALGNADEYKLSEQGAVNADVIDNGDGVTGADANAIQAIEAGFVKQTDFPMTKAQLDSAMGK